MRLRLAVCPPAMRLRPSVCPRRVPFRAYRGYFSHEPRCAEEIGEMTPLMYGSREETAEKGRLCIDFPPRPVHK